MDNAKEIIDFLTEYFEGEKIQIFYTRNIAGDLMYTIYEKDNVQIDYCSEWDYIEIFGLNKEDYNKVVETIGSVLSAYRY